LAEAGEVSNDPAQQTFVYVVHIVLPWSSIQIKMPDGRAVQPAGTVAGRGFAPVYDMRAEAEKDWPGHEIVAMEYLARQKVPARCCERDDDGDGNCDIHASPGVLRKGWAEEPK